MPEIATVAITDAIIATEVAAVFAFTAAANSATFAAHSAAAV